MNYQHIMDATFIERPNRFIAQANLQGNAVTCHVKNTGRCKELLQPNANVILQHHPNAASLGRKTNYSLIQVYKQMDHGMELINLDSQAPNQVVAEWLDSGGLSHVTQIRREVTYGSSRFDFSFLRKGVPSFMEVKGVTLEEHGIARFPDAPTLRGVKHLKELEQAALEGFGAYVLFVIAMKGVHKFEPNMITHPEFGQTLAHASRNGVTLFAYDSVITPSSFILDAPIPIELPI